MAVTGITWCEVGREQGQRWVNFSPVSKQQLQKDLLDIGSLSLHILPQ
jgi:hypothetical protein